MVSDFPPALPGSLFLGGFVLGGCLRWESTIFAPLSLQPCAGMELAFLVGTPSKL